MFVREPEQAIAIGNLTDCEACILTLSFCLPVVELGPSTMLGGKRYRPRAPAVFWSVGVVLGVTLFLRR